MFRLLFGGMKSAVCGKVGTLIGLCVRVWIRLDIHSHLGFGCSVLVYQIMLARLLHRSFRSHLFHHLHSSSSPSLLLPSTTHNTPLPALISSSPSPISCYRIHTLLSSRNFIMPQNLKNVVVLGGSYGGMRKRFLFCLCVGRRAFRPPRRSATLICVVFFVC